MGRVVASMEMLIAATRAIPTLVRFTDVERACRHFLGDPRQTGGSPRWSAPGL